MGRRGSVILLYRSYYYFFFLPVFHFIWSENHGNHTFRSGEDTHIFFGIYLTSANSGALREAPERGCVQIDLGGSSLASFLSEKWRQWKSRRWGKERTLGNEDPGRVHRWALPSLPFCHGHGEWMTWSRQCVSADWLDRGMRGAGDTCSYLSPVYASSPQLSTPDFYPLSLVIWK